MDGDTGRAKTPEEAAEEAIGYFQSQANEERAAKFQRYFKEPVNYYGVDYGPYKEWKADFLESLRPGWTVEDAVRFCEIVLEDDHMESRGMGYQVVGEFVEGAGPDLLEKVKGWLEGFCGNWGLVDNLAPSVLTRLLRKYPELAGEVKGWARSENQWVRRGSAVAFVELVGEEPFRDDPYEVATALQGDTEDLTRKAVGWLLREAGKVDRDRLEAYLLEQGPKVPRTTLRYAIEKFSKEDRKRIMEATK
jgi:3-methyladenine DNA glycosylase AlkD